MGLIEQEISELRQMAKDVRDGKITPEIAALQIGFYNQTSKRVSQLIQIAMMESKGGKATKKLISANVISAGSAIPITSSDKEVIKCPEQGGLLIDRESCLDYSGDSRHIDACQRCDQFEVTRKICFNRPGGCSE